MRKKMRNDWKTLVLALLCVLLCQVAQAQPVAPWGEIRQASQNLNVRKARDFRSEHVLTLKKGDRVKVDFLEDGWYAVFPPDATERDLNAALGFSKAKFLTFVAKASTATAPSVQLDTSAPKTAEPSTAPTPKHTMVPGDAPKVVAEVQERPEDIKPEPVKSPKEPVRITADKLTYDDNNRTVAFSGHVEAEHEGMRLWAEQLTAYFAKNGTPGEEIDRIVASGGVKMQQADIVGRSDTVTYKVRDALLLMQGQPEIQEGKNTVTGKVIKFYVREKRSEVMGGSGKRVEAILFAPEGLEAP